MLAPQVGLNANGLAEEEEGLLPEGACEATYAAARNRVLARWRGNVARYLTQKAALANLPKEERPYALAAWRFLNGGSACAGGRWWAPAGGGPRPVCVVQAAAGRC